MGAGGRPGITSLFDSPLKQMRSVTSHEYW